MSKRRTLKKVSVKMKSRIQKMPGPQLYSPREKLQNCIWEFTIGDADDKPSVPHAHDRENGYRLDAWTGDIYPAGKERVDTIGKLKPKELSKLHRDPRFVEFAQKQINWYREDKPHISFYVPEWFELKNMQKMAVTMKQSKPITNFVFIGQANIYA